MKKIAKIGLLLLCGFVAQAQNRFSERISLGFNVSQDITSAILVPNKNYAPMICWPPYTYTPRVQRAKPALRYTLAANIAFRLSSHFSLETGLQIADKGYNLFFENTETSVPRYMRHVVFLSFPVKMNLVLGKKRLRFCANLGTSLDINLGRSLHTVSASVGMGIDYKINDRINIKIEPTYRQAFSIFPSHKGWVNQLIPNFEYYYSVGLNAACYFRL